MNLHRADRLDRRSYYSIATVYLLAKLLLPLLDREEKQLLQEVEEK